MAVTDSSLPVPPKVFISYSHDSPEHAERVLRLADRLRENGVDAVLDQYVTSPDEGWPIWMETQIRNSDFVLVICSENYLHRAQRREKTGVGLGVIWESVLVEQLIYEASIRNTKFIPVLAQGAEPRHIPNALKAVTFYRLDDLDEYEHLLRRLTNQTFAKEPSRKLRALPSRNLSDSVLEPVRAWNVPFERNWLFVDRDEILEQLYADLTKNRKQVLCGMGGIGKTAIAVEYAYRYRETYSAVLWTSAESEQSLNAGFAHLARVLGVPRQIATTESVRRWLDRTPDWLLILDNADHPAILRSFIPERINGHILITSRAHAFQQLGILTPIEVPVLPADAAKRYLLMRTGHDLNENLPSADTLVNELGYHPLALAQAGAFIAENQSSLDGYLTSFRKRGLDLLKERHSSSKEGLVTSWIINFQEVEQFPASADLLRLSAFLAPDMIPFELLERGSINPGETLDSQLIKIKDDPVIFDELLKPLLDYALIRKSATTKSYSIHPLVQLAIRDSMPRELQSSWAERAIGYVNAAFPDVPTRDNRADSERLIPQVLTCSQLIDSFQLKSETGARLLNRAAYYLHQQGLFQQAEPLYRQGLALAETCLGPENPETANVLSNLATLLAAMGRYAEAEPLYRRSLGIKEQFLRPTHPSLAATLNELGLLYQQTAKFVQAESHYRRALQILEQAFGPQHPSVAKALERLGGLCADEARYQEAELLFRRALQINEGTLGAEHPAAVSTANHLAKVYQRLGKTIEAEHLLAQAHRGQMAIDVLGDEKAVFLLGFANELRSTTLANLASLVGLDESEVRQTWQRLSESGYGIVHGASNEKQLTIEVTDAGRHALSLLRLTKTV